MSEAVGPLSPGQRLSLTGSAVPANLDNSGSSGQQLVRVSKTNQAGYDVIPLDVAKLTGNPDLDGYVARYASWSWPCHLAFNWQDCTVPAWSTK